MKGLKAALIAWVRRYPTFSGLEIIASPNQCL